MSKRKLKKDEYIDRYGQVQRHSAWYMENQRKQKIRRTVCGGALAAVLSVLVLTGVHAKNKAADREEERTEEDRAETDRIETVRQGAEDTELAAGEKKAEELTAEARMPRINDISVEMGFTSEETVAADERGNGKGILSESDPDRFYSGYKTYSDASTQTITDEGIISSYCVLVDLSDGHIVAGRDANERMVPASMTKVLTVLTAADLVEDPDDTFVITQEICDYVWQHRCSQVGYLPDEEVTVRELFYGTILPSGGDAAVALAYYTCGSIEAFADKMNEKCEELGISDVAHFTNPAGIYDEENYCTPASMAMIMKAAEENTFLSEVLGTRIYRTANTEQHPEGIEISNWFIRRIEDKDTHGTVLGAKTGFVNESGNCAVSCLHSNDGHDYICVTGNAWSAWRAIYDHVAIYDAYVN